MSRALTSAIGLLAIGSLTGCRTNVSLGDPVDGRARPFAPAAGVCPATESNAIFTTFEPGAGELRALAARDGLVVAAFARADGTGVVALSSGGPFVELARACTDPLSMMFDGTDAFVACRDSAQVYAVRAGESVVATLPGSVSSVAVAAGGRGAVWTVPTSDAVMAWAPGEAAPALIATVPRAQSVAARDGTLWITGAHALWRLGPNDVAPTKIADVCGAGRLAVEPDAVYCIDDGVLRRIDARTRAVTALAGGLRATADVIVARGRAFFRSDGTSGATLQAVPIDGVGGPTVIDALGVSPSAMASDGCGLYYAKRSTLNRLAL